MTSKAILSDIDGVVADWMGGFLSWLEKERGITPRSVKIDDLDLSKNILNFLSHEEMHDLVKEFNQSNAYSLLELFEGTYKGFAVIKYLLPPSWQFAAVTSTGLHPFTARERAGLCLRLGFDVLHLTDYHVSKADIYAEYAPGSIVLEDHPGHAEAALDYGHHVLLFEKPYNQALNNHRHLYRVFNMGEASRIVNDIIEVSP